MICSTLKKGSFILLGVLFILIKVKAQENFQCSLSDINTIQEIINSPKLDRKTPYNELIIAIGELFIDTPYEGKTLDQNTDTEKVVAHLSGLDCSTFIDTILALTLTIKNGEKDAVDFFKILESVRYRDSKLNGYASRLHYFSDWLQDNTDKGYLRNITKEIGGVEFNKEIKFMSTNRKNYAQLAKNDSLLDQIKEVEKKLNSKQHFYIPKEKVKSIGSNLKSGDIIGITTSIPLLDISHVGIIKKVRGKCYLLHASLGKKKVVLSEKTLDEYLEKYSKHTGIVVGSLVID